MTEAIETIEDLVIEKDGKYYRKIGNKEVIGKNAFKSFQQGEMKAVVGKDTIKLKPKDFPAEWVFYRQVEE